jgi:hypothetical protein
MEDDIHYAHLDVGGVFRAICGTWRRAQNWTTLKDLVTCPACRRALAEERRAVGRRDELAVDA